MQILTHVRVFAVAQITASQFTARFDLYINWPEQVVGAVEFAQSVEDSSLANGNEAKALAWHPIVRFPNAIQYTQGMRLIFADTERRRIGVRTTVQGTFKVSSAANAASFPFDSVPLELVMQLGFEKNSKQQLYADQYQFAMNPEQPNLIYAQHDHDYSFRTPRHKVLTTTPLEAPQAISKFVVVVPATRKWQRHVFRIVPMLALLSAASLVLFAVPVDELGVRAGGSLLLLLAQVMAKVTRNLHWPTTQEITWLDKCEFLVWLYLFMNWVHL